MDKGRGGSLGAAGDGDYDEDEEEDDNDEEEEEDEDDEDDGGETWYVGGLSPNRTEFHAKLDFLATSPLN